MDFNNDYNDPIRFDQSLIMGKLGFDRDLAVIHQAPVNNVDDINKRIQLALLEKENLKNKQMPTIVEPIKRETFVSGGCTCTDGMCSKSTKVEDTILGINSTKFLMLVIVVLVAICISQYFANQNDLAESINSLYMMLQQSKMQQTSSVTAPVIAPTITQA
jgi:hypothetical protein